MLFSSSRRIGPRPRHLNEGLILGGAVRYDGKKLNIPISVRIYPFSSILLCIAIATCESEPRPRPGAPPPDFHPAALAEARHRPDLAAPANARRLLRLVLPTPAAVSIGVHPSRPVRPGRQALGFGGPARRPPAGRPLRHPLSGG
jgi:hypothetical protein